MVIQALMVWELWNFYKMRMVASIISDIQKAQKHALILSKDPQILGFVTYGLHVLEEDSIWELSQKMWICSFWTGLPPFFILRLEALQAALSDFRNFKKENCWRCKGYSQSTICFCKVDSKSDSRQPTPVNAIDWSGVNKMNSPNFWILMFFEQ